MPKIEVRKLTLSVFVAAEHAESIGKQLRGEWDELLDSWDGEHIMRGELEITEASREDADEYREMVDGE